MDLGVGVINMVGAFAAFGINSWAAMHMSGWLRRMFNVIAGLALFYALAYFWLVLHLDQVKVWSDFLRPVGLVSWVVAWCLEPIIITREMRKHSRKMLKETDQVVERFKQVA